MEGPTESQPAVRRKSSNGARGRAMWQVRVDAVDKGLWAQATMIPAVCGRRECSMIPKSHLLRRLKVFATAVLTGLHEQPANMSSYSRP
jgi:hypothetical protein